MDKLDTSSTPAAPEAASKTETRAKPVKLSRRGATIGQYAREKVGNRMIRLFGPGANLTARDGTQYAVGPDGAFRKQPDLLDCISWVETPAEVAKLLEVAKSPNAFGAGYVRRCVMAADKRIAKLENMENPNA